MGYHCAHGNPAFTEEADGSGAGFRCADFPRLVRGAIRAASLGSTRQDSASAMDGLPALVSQSAGAGYSQRSSHRCHFAARRWRRGTAYRCAGRPVGGGGGFGGVYLPPLAQNLPQAWWAHSCDDMDYGKLAGKRVGVIGAGASAMDSAATALEAGAERVDLLIRRAQFPRINKGKGAGNPGLTNGHVDLPDEWKWR